MDTLSTQGMNIPSTQGTDKNCLLIKTEIILKMEHLI
jgi:hypothetical protein